MKAYKTYNVSVIIEGTTYNYHLASEKGVRELFALIQAPVQDFIIIEEIGRSQRELGFTEISRILSPEFATV